MGKVEGGMKCVKYLLFIFNFIFWLMGSLVLAIGLWLRLESRTVSLLDADAAPVTFYIGVYILIAAGGLMMLVGFFGCCGAARESQCLLTLFFVCLLIIFGAEVAAGVFGFLNKDTIVADIQRFYKDSVEDTNSTDIVTSFHKVLNCCGSAATKNTQCVDQRTKDCEEAIEDFFSTKLFIIGYVGVGIAGVMIIGMIFSMVLCCAVRNSREVV
ncbi:CD9 antigen [Trichomycterus rosablanca]|uniref:CD9 antigen n=1 Tax=Trichomycterus rosablanca TaxID=2290929 RepID=UPI002F351652